MTNPEDSGAEILLVARRFPERADAIMRLAACDESFAGVCEDYALARSALARLSRPAPASRSTGQLEEYRSIVADLEREIAEALQRAV